MIKEIKYSGLTNVPGDTDCADGEIASLINLSVENGEVKPFVRPEPFMTVQGRLLGVHRGSDYENFITLDNGYLYTQRKDSARTRIGAYRGDIVKMEVLGNTLIMISEVNPLRYYLFKNENYIDLGEKPPFPEINFGLRGTIKKSSALDDIRFADWIEIDLQVATNKVAANIEFGENNKKKVSDELLPYVNKFIQEESKDKGKFMYPFFVRYAYRLYDGSLTMHSSPILMIPSTGCAPYVATRLLRNPESNWFTGLTETQIAAFLCDIDYTITNLSDLNGLSTWEDIVKSVDIFISAPIYTYDQNGQCWGLNIYTKETVNDFPYYGVLCCDDKMASDGSHLIFEKTNLYKEEQLWMANVQLPTVSQDKITEEITRTSLFYKIHSIELEKLTEPAPPGERDERRLRKIIALKDNVLNTLQLQEVMTDDYNSHNFLSAATSYVYNSRLNLASINEKLFNGFAADALCCREAYTDSGVGVSWTIYTYIKDDGRDIIVEKTKLVPIGQVWGIYIYFPNPKAYKMCISMDYFAEASFHRQWTEISLKPHPNLNGAFFFSGFDNLVWTDISVKPMPAITVTPEPKVLSPNKIFNSELNNPFVFPVTGINTIGTGEIRAIASATKALSQGQFGQFPLYVFSSEGIWALEISDIGTYSSRQMVARDVINNPASILQLDGAIAFTSDRGVMLLQGSDVICISGNQDGPTFKIDDLISCDKLIEVIADDAIAAILGNTVPLKDYLSGSFMSYDYPNSRIIIVNPGYGYGYAYNISSNSWSTITSDYVRSANNYPDSYLTNTAGDVVNISKVISNDDLTVVKGILISRPLKLDIPDVLKTINTIAHRGIFKDSNIGSILYGSRNGEQYIPIASAKGKYIRRLHGSPYNFYRIALIIDMQRKESISGLTVDFVPKYTNKVR